MGVSKVAETIGKRSYRATPHLEPHLGYYMRNLDYRSFPAPKTAVLGQRKERKMRKENWKSDEGGYFSKHGKPLAVAIYFLSFKLNCSMFAASVRLCTHDI